MSGALEASYTTRLIGLFSTVALAPSFGEGAAVNPGKAELDSKPEGA